MMMTGERLLWAERDFYFGVAAGSGGVDGVAIRSSWSLTRGHCESLRMTKAILRPVRFC
jgi:hypothetical protein